MHLMNFFRQRKVKENVLYLSALSGEKQSFIQHIDAISSEQLLDQLLESNPSSETAWHATACYQQSGGFGALLKRLKNNDHIHHDHWTIVMGTLYCIALSTMNPVYWMISYLIAFMMKKKY